MCLKMDKIRIAFDICSKEWKEYANKTTIHGLKKSVSGSLLHRITWALLSFTAIGITLFIGINIKSSYSNKVGHLSTSLKNIFTEIPEIGICQPIFIEPRALKGMSYEILTEMLKNTKDSKVSEEICKNRTFNNRLNNLAGTLFPKVLKATKFGFRISKFFWTNVLNNDGACIHFHGSSIHSTNHVEWNEYKLKIGSSVDLTNYNRESFGYSLIINGLTNPPYQEKLMIYPGITTKVQIVLSNIVSESNCIDNSKNDCLLRCVFYGNSKKLNCIPKYFRSNKLFAEQINYCDDCESELDFFRKVFFIDDVKKRRECHESCPDNCKGTTYNINYYAKPLVDKKTNVTLIKVRFYTSRKILSETYQQFEEYIASFGGIAAIFIGSSFLTVFEVFEFLINVVKRIITKFKVSPADSDVKQ